MDILDRSAISRIVLDVVRMIENNPNVQEATRFWEDLRVDRYARRGYYKPIRKNIEAEGSRMCGVGPKDFENPSSLGKLVDLVHKSQALDKTSGGRRTTFSIILGCIYLGALFSGIAIAQESESASGTIFSRLEEMRISLHRSYQGPDRDEPAQFGYVKARDDKAEFFTNFCLDYQVLRDPYPIYGGFASFDLSAEGHVSSTNETIGDSWVFRAGCESDWWTRSAACLYVCLNAAFEADREFKTQYAYGELVLTPTFRTLAIGKALPVATLEPDGIAKEMPPVQFIWRPFLSLAVGRRIRGHPPGRDEDTLLRIRPRATAKLLLNYISRPLGFNEIYFYGDAICDYLPDEYETGHWHYETGMVFGFNQKVSLVCNYSRGKRAPNYLEEDIIALTLGIGF